MYPAIELAAPSRAREDIEIRPAGADDVEGLAGLFAAAYADSSHPCKDTSFVRSTIDSPSFLWRVAAAGARIVACSAVVEHAWNRTWEIGRGVTHPDYRNEGLGASLCQQCVSAACLTPNCDLVHGYPRNAIIAKIAAQAHPSLCFTGHDGGINVANGTREYHGMIVGRNPHARFRHFAPGHTSAFVRQNIFTPLEMDPEPGPFPTQWTAGAGAAPVNGHAFSIDHDPSSRSGSLEVTGYCGVASTAREFAQELQRMLEQFPTALHTRLTVLADKIGLIHELTLHDFESVAYLPAWYWREDGRFDCVLMARRRFSEEPVAHGLQDVVNRFRAGLAPC